MKNPLKIAFASLLFLCAVILLPGSAAAQQISVSPTSISVQANVGTNAAPQTVQVKKRGKPTVQVSWSVVQPTVSWLSVSPTSGVNDATLTLNFATTSLAAGQYQTSFRVQNASSSSTVTVQATIVGSAPPPLVANCPANKTVASPDGNPVPVSYTIPAPSGGTSPYFTSGLPASDSSFPVGTTTVKVTATDSSQPQKTATCNFTVTVTDSRPPSSTGVGPQSTIACPSGAIDIYPGTNNIQAQVDLYPGGTIFCLLPGTFSVTSAITPKTGDVFVGKNGGAILDGTGWNTTDGTQGAFRSYKQDIDNVTIKNLFIRNMPSRGIVAYYQYSDGWTIENNDIANCEFGVDAPNNSFLRNNYIHHNKLGGYSGYHIVNTLFDSNEIAFNNSGQKVLFSDRVTFRNNYVHDNYDGIHYDSDNTNALIEGNRIENQGRNGIFFEYSMQGTIRNNTIKNSGESGILVSVSKNVETYGNTLQGNFRAIQYFLDCGTVGGGVISYDLADNNTHDNYITVDTTSGAFANAFTYLSSCTSTQYSPYMNGSKNLIFQNNHYTVPSTGGRWWVWGLNGFKYWIEWQALPQDSMGTVQ